MKAIAAFILASSFVAFVSGCSRPTGSFVIPDVTATFTTNLTASTSRGNVMVVGLHVHGQLDGAGYISGSAWATQALNGVVDRRSFHDYFETNCVISYSPGSAKSGKLRLEYWF